MKQVLNGRNWCPDVISGATSRQLIMCMILWVVHLKENEKFHQMNLNLFRPFLLRHLYGHTHVFKSARLKKGWPQGWYPDWSYWGKMGKFGVKWVGWKIWINFDKQIFHYFLPATTAWTLLDIVNIDSSVQGLLFSTNQINTTHFTPSLPTLPPADPINLTRILGSQMDWYVQAGHLLVEEWSALSKLLETLRSKSSSIVTCKSYRHCKHPFAFE